MNETFAHASLRCLFLYIIFGADWHEKDVRYTYRLLGALLNGSQQQIIMQCIFYLTLITFLYII